MIRLLTLTLGLTPLFIIAGCGTQTVQVDGKLVKNGVPFTTSSSDVIDMVFMWTDPNGVNKSSACSFNGADGTFSVIGPTDRGVPPGEYRIAITGQKYPADPDPRKNQDLFGGAFTAENTPLKYTVAPSSSQHIIIDLARKTVTPQA